MRGRKEIFNIKKEENLVGEGSQNRVFQDPHRPERVIGFYKGGHENPPEVKGRFYLTKILHILFPDNIPDIEFSTSEPSTTGRQKVELGPLHEKVKKYILSVEKERVKPERAGDAEEAEETIETIEKDERVQKLIMDLRKVGVRVDAKGVNFGFDERGNVKYIEIFPAYSRDFGGVVWPSVDMTKLETAIKKLDPEQRQRASLYVVRLKKNIEEARGADHS